ncbi:MAG TPA: YceI family protein [Gaiellaceae bacterium]|nr:YceI family protein [Gaiellaceae bacterium]
MATTETLAPAGTWRLDPVHSSVAFEVAYLGGTFKGAFREVEARLRVEGESAALEGAALVASVDVKDENLAAHLQSPDFFDAERFPELRFAAADVALDGDGVAADGEVTIRGITRPVRVTGTAAGPLVDPYGRERVALALTAAVDRTLFGLEWNAPLPTGEPALANEVAIVADLTFVKEA